MNRRILIPVFLIAATAFAQTNPGLHSRSQTGQDNTETRAAKGMSTLPDNASGEFTLDGHGSVIQITIERGRLTGYVSFMERDNALTLFFDQTSIQGNRVTFTTKIVHGLRYSFRGEVVRGSAETPSMDGYYQLAGELTTYRGGTQEKKRVNLKSTPRD